MSTVALTRIAEAIDVYAPARIARPMPRVRETYTVPEGEVLEFRHEARRAGMTIVRSAPVPGGYAMTIEH